MPSYKGPDQKSWFTQNWNPQKCWPQIFGNHDWGVLIVQVLCRYWTCTPRPGGCLQLPGSSASSSTSPGSSRRVTSRRGNLRRSTTLPRWSSYCSKLRKISQSLPVITVNGSDLRGDESEPRTSAPPTILQDLSKISLEDGGCSNPDNETLTRIGGRLKTFIKFDYFFRPWYWAQSFTKPHSKACCVDLYLQLLLLPLQLCSSGDHHGEACHGPVGLVCLRRHPEDGVRHHGSGSHLRRLLLDNWTTFKKVMSQMITYNFDFWYLIRC